MTAPVLNNSVPANGRKITALEFSRLSIRGINVKRSTMVEVLPTGFMIVSDATGRQHAVSRRA